MKIMDEEINKMAEMYNMPVEEIKKVLGGNLGQPEGRSKSTKSSSISC